MPSAAPVQSYRCLLFGEIRALLGGRDFIEVQVLQHGLTNEVTGALLWDSICSAITAACDAMHLDAHNSRRIHDVMGVAMIALDDEYVDKNDREHAVCLPTPGCQLAVIPPVSGG